MPVHLAVYSLSRRVHVLGVGRDLLHVPRVDTPTPDKVRIYSSGYKPPTPPKGKTQNSCSILQAAA